ncbi:hypothetical protein JA9_002216 [Meyerozyma sp. JA9]|nr:hypothetical protein JA9_002216 [Meyerozyma sp. JA9]
MITSTLLLSTSLLYFVFPLLLTVKTVSDISDPVRTSHRAIFLLHYWLCYWFVGQMQTIVSIASLAGFPLSTDLAAIVFSAVKIWLFYYHGCLVVPRVLLQPFICRFFQTNSLVQFEALYVEPIAKQLPSGSLFASDLGFLTSYARFQGAYTRAGTSFLSFCLDHICYLDSDQMLLQRYHNLTTTAMSWLGYLRSYVDLPPSSHHHDRCHSHSFSPKMFQLSPPPVTTTSFPDTTPKSVPRSSSKTYNLDLDFFTRRKNDIGPSSPSLDYLDTDIDDTFDSVDDSMEFLSKPKDVPRTVRKVESASSLNNVADELPLMGSRSRSHSTSKAERPTIDRINHSHANKRSFSTPQDPPYPLTNTLPAHPSPESFLVSRHRSSSSSSNGHTVGHTIGHTSGHTIDPIKVRKFKRKEPPREF